MYTLLIKNGRVINYINEKITPHLFASKLAGEFLSENRPYPRQWEANDESMWIKRTDGENMKTELFSVRWFDEKSVKHQTYRYLYVIQFYGYLGWEDCAQYDYNNPFEYDPAVNISARKNMALEDMRLDLYEYRRSGGSYRTVTRREAF